MLSSTVGLVTGGCSGLGRSAALRILRSGGSVVLADLPSQSHLADPLVEEFGSSRCRYYPTDVTKEEDVMGALDEAENGGMGVVNATVNCAGIATPSKILGKRGVHDLEL